MSTELLEQSAGAGAVPAEGQDESALPEQQAAGDAHQQTDAGEAADQSQGSEEADKGLTEEQKTIRKLTRRIERLTAKRGAAEREAELYRQQLAGSQQRDGRQGEDGEPGEGRKLTESDIEQLARQKAEEMTLQRAIGEKVGKVLKEGSKLDGFNQAIDAVAEVVPFMDKKGKPTPFIEAVLDSDNPAQLLKHLGENPEEAEELADLNPVQLGRRIAKLEDKLKQSAKKTTSAAPQPIRPVGGNASGSIEPDPDKDPAAWIAARNRAAVRGALL